MRYFLVFLCFFVLACNKIENRELPTNEHTQAYSDEFKKDVYEQLPKNQVALLNSFLLRVRNFEHGTTVEDGIELQKIYEQELKEKKEKEFIATKAEYSKKLNEYKEFVSSEKTRISQLNEKKIKEQIAKDVHIIETKLTSIEEIPSYKYKYHRYEMTYKMKIRNNLGVYKAKMSVLGKKSDGSNYDMEIEENILRKFKKDDDKNIYTGELSLRTTDDKEPINKSDKKRAKQIKFVIKDVFFRSGFDVKVTLSTYKNYIKRLEKQLTKLEEKYNSFLKSKSNSDLYRWDKTASKEFS
ncbi:MAG: hypothetical protein KAJ75_01950 [Alphaproteobacteria bacterium]|nr:hypothetical protein [Alphaproteobacteria bacterium]